MPTTETCPHCQTEHHNVHDETRLIYCKRCARPFIPSKILKESP